MKKFLKITAAIIFSLLIFFVGIFKYRQFRANRILISKNAVTVIKISVDEIYKSLAANLIANPGFYFKSDLKKEPFSKTDRFENGLKIPASIYFYTIDKAPETTIFSRLEIKNFDEFEGFLQNTLHLQISKRNGNLRIAKSKLGNIVICYNDENAALALATQIEDYEPILLDILNQKKFIKLSNSNFSKLLEQKEHLAFSNKENNGWVSFNNGAINLSNEFSANNLIPTKGKHQKLNEKATISFWLNANLKSTENKIYKYKNISLEQDSLLKYFNGNIDFEWINSFQKNDSVITYEYNDDFEKVEKISVQKKLVPNFIINVNTKTNGLKKYLAKQGLVNLDSNVIDKNIFPLYYVFVNESPKNLSLSTQKAISVNNENVLANDFVYLDVDFQKLSKQINEPIVTKYFKLLDRLKIKGKVLTGGKANLNADLELKNKDINSLYQLLKSL